MNMKSLHWGLLCAAACFIPPAYALSEDEKCPLVGLSALATTCGDNVCNGFGLDVENVDNCARDCATGDLKKILPYYAENTNVCKEYATVYEPSNAAEVQDAVRESVQQGRTIKMVGTRHSTSNIICGQGNVMTSEKLKSIQGISTITDGPYSNVEVVTFDSGVTFRSDDAKINPATNQPYVGLMDYLASNDKALNYSATGFAGITVGGALATGVHGSNAKGTSNVAHEVQELWVVAANGDLVRYSKGTTGVSKPDTWKALTTNLGVLGPVVKISMRVRDQFALHTKVNFHDETELLSDGGLDELVKDCHFSFMTWFPGRTTSKVINTCALETTAPVTDPSTIMTLFTPNIADEFTVFFKTLSQGATCPSIIGGDDYLNLRSYANLRVGFMQDPNNAWVESNNREVRGYEGIGYSHNIINRDITSNYPGFSATDWEVALPRSQTQAALRVIEEVVNKYDVALPSIGVVIRFDQATDNSLMSGVSARSGIPAGEPMVHLEIPVFTPWKMRGEDLVKWQKPWQEIMTRLVIEFDSRPHWGKNQDWLLQHPAVLQRIAPEIARLQNVINELDPKGVFSNKWAARLGLNWPQGPSYDTDADGLTDAQESSLGTNPDKFNGFKSTLANGDPSGSCNYMDNYAEMQSRFSNPLQTGNKTAGWNFNTGHHNYSNNAYGVSPQWQGNGSSTWSVRHQGEFMVAEAGRYCFSADNGSSGSGIISGRNSCLQVWAKEQRVAEVGYNSVQQNSSCIDLEQGANKLDISARYHNANWWRNFKMNVKWCKASGSSCTPNQALSPQQLQAVD